MLDLIRSRTLPKRALQAVALIAVAYIGVRAYGFITDFLNPLSREFMGWWQVETNERDQFFTVQRDPCPNGHFSLPTDGFIGLYWDDPRGPYSARRTHQGIDIFSNPTPGITPVYAAYDGYITRESDWVSTIIQRIPSDPLNPDQQIWLYYTHLADENGNDFIEPAFDRGTKERFVPRGTLLGYVGNYDGNVPSRIGTHLHFSVVQDDEDGDYLNEYYIDNTLDPSPYFGFDVNYQSAEPGPKTCQTASK